MRPDHTTDPIAVGPVTVGDTEASVMPFEPADVDFSAVNKMRTRDPTYGQNQVPDAIVNSCSQCCMAEINGKPNLLGRLHRAMVDGCGHCPVGMSGDHIQARDGDGNLMFHTYADGTRRPITQTEAMYMDIDSTA